MTSTGVGAALPEVSSPVEVRLGGPVAQRRVTVLFRAILAIPQFIVLALLSIAALVVVVIGWCGALVTGRLPRFAVEFLAGFLRWETRYAAYLFFVTDTYPPFSMQPSAGYPVDFWVQTGRLNRLSVLFRLVLVIPTAIVTAVLYHGLVLFSVVLWVATLIKGEPPRAFFDGVAAVIRYRARYAGFAYLLTSVYPGGLYGDGIDGEVAAEGVPGATPSAVDATPITPAAPQAVPGGVVAPSAVPIPGAEAPMPPVPGAATPPPDSAPVPSPASTPIADPSAPSIESIPAGFGQLPSAPVTPGAVPMAPPPGPMTPPGAVPVPGALAAAAPEYEPAAASPSPAPWSPWKLLLSAGGRTMVTVLLVIGSVAYLGEIIVRATSHHQSSTVIVVPDIGTGGTGGTGGSTGTGGTSGGPTGTSGAGSAGTGTSPGTSSGTSPGTSGGQAGVTGKGAAAKLASAWGPANDGIQAYAAGITVCAALSGQAAVQCADAADAALGQVFTTYAADLAEIHFPAAAVDQSAAALTAAQRAATVFTAISGSGTDTARQQRRSQVNITRVQNTYAALAAAVGS